MIGSVVVDEVVMPITDLWLSGGKLQIAASARGPLPLMHLADYVVIGADGVVVYRSSRPGEMATVGPLGPQDEVSVDLAVGVDDRTTRPSGPVRISDQPPGGRL